MKLEQKFAELSNQRQKRIMYVASFTPILIVAVSSYIWYILTGEIDGDLLNYYNNTNDLLVNHLMPYSDYTFEYPPLSLLIFLIPRIFSWNFSSFIVAFFVFATIATMVAVCFTIKICDKYEISRFKIMLLIVLMIFAANKFVIQRNDIFAVALVILALYFFTEKHHIPSAVMLGLATMIKLYPLVLVPVFAIMLFSKKDWKNTAIMFITAIMTCFIIELPFLINDPSSAFAYLTYHSDRGLQVEGVISSILLIIDMIVPVVDDVSFLYGSVTLTGEIPDAIATVMNYILMAALVIMAFWFIYRLWKNNKDEKSEFKILALASIIAVAVFIAFNKVFSTQYVLWLLAFIPFISFKGKFEYALFLIFLVFIPITPFCSGELLKHEFSPFVEIELFVKNLIFIVWLIIWFKKFNEMTKDVVIERKTSISSAHHRSI